jgi:tRNA-2-methylthio-N6-dimethylallyladenosine synthase
METTKRVFRVDRKDINYLRTTIESYDGMAVVRTVDPHAAYIEISISPRCEGLVFNLLDSLAKDEGLKIDNYHSTIAKMSRTFYIKTMGCQMNEYDSDFLARSLIYNGFSPVDDPADADVILINTCTVRAKPEQKAVSLLGRMTAIKRRKPGLILCIVGCLAQKEGGKLMKRFPQLDLVMGPRELGRFQDVIGRIDTNGEKIVATGLESAPPHPVHCKGYFNGRVTGYISIMEGCNNFCSYCVVPFVRGREISRSPADILVEANNLILDGIKDITLLGQNVLSYRWEKEEKSDFVSLLRELGKLEGLLRLRFTTSHPKDLSDEIIQCFGDINNLCPHIHLPFQAGSNAILKRMNRGYTAEKYMELIAKLRMVRPDIAATSDVMVGFPGETDEDFDMTLDLIKRVQFDGLFSFKYSDRNGTLAAKMSDKVQNSEKIRRLKVLQKLQKQITFKKNRDLEGRQMQVLVEGQSKKRGQLTGRTGTNKIVNFIGNIKQVGHLVELTIKDGCRNSLRGQ